MRLKQLSRKISPERRCHNCYEDDLKSENEKETFTGHSSTNDRDKQDDDKRSKLITSLHKYLTTFFAIAHCRIDMSHVAAVMQVLDISHLDLKTTLLTIIISYLSLLSSTASF